MLHQVIPMTAEKLCRIETFSDNVGGTVICFLPVLLDGQFDPLRTPYFKGQLSIAVNNGPLQPFNFSFPLECQTLEDAVKAWVPEVQKAFADYTEQLQTNSIRNKLLEGTGRKQ